MAQRPTFADVAAAARGRWPEILAALSIPAERLRPAHGPCPGCGGKDRYRFDDRNESGSWLCNRGGAGPIAGDGFDLLRHVYDWTAAEALRAVAQCLGMDHENPPQTLGGGYVRRNGDNGEYGDRPRSAVSVRSAPSEETPPRDPRTDYRLRCLWRESSPIRADAVPDLVAAYWRGRGLGDVIQAPPADLRYHPALGYYDPAPDGPRLVGTFPAVLAIVRDAAGDLVTLHRTWLDPDGGGKAPVRCPRKLAPLRSGASMRGAAIRLHPPTGGRLILAEGIETCLAGHLLRPEWGAWATVSAGGLAAVDLPADVREVLILADHDRAGIEAAHRAGERLAECCDVSVALPPDGPGTDWADIVAATTPDQETRP